MPLDVGDWRFGPELGFGGNLVCRLGEEQVREYWSMDNSYDVDTFQQWMRTLREGLRKLGPAPRPWVVPEQFEEDPSGGFRFLLERVHGVSLGQLSRRLEQLKRELPVETACFICLEVAKGLLGAMPSPNRLVTPKGVWLSWDGSVRLALFPLDTFHPRGGSGSLDAFVKQMQGIDGGEQYLVMLLELMLGAERVPADLKALGEKGRVKHLCAQLEKSADGAWLKQELGQLFPNERVSQQSEDDWTQGRHPDQLTPELIDQIAAQDDAATFQVLTDHLLAHNRPRAELAQLQSRRVKAHPLEEAELFQKWRELAPVDPASSELKLEWRAGWVVGATVPNTLAPERMGRLLGHPAMVFLRRLSVSAGPETCEAATARVARKHCPSLRRLELAHGADAARERVREAMPRLEVVTLAPKPVRKAAVPQPPGVLSRLRSALFGRPR